jgi:hypothetical protein
MAWSGWVTQLYPNQTLLHQETAKLFASLMMLAPALFIEQLTDIVFSETQELVIDPMQS